MAYVLNEEQSMLKDSAREFLKNNAPVSQLRSLRDSQEALGYDEGTWQQMVEMGWTALTIPEEYGGMGFGYFGLGQILEESGRTLTSSPLISSALMGTTAIIEAGTRTQKSDLLPKLIEGALKMTLAIDESNRHDPKSTSTSLQAQNGGFMLNGQKQFVPDGHTSDKIIVFCKDSNGKATLVIVDRNTDGLVIETDQMMDSRIYSTMRFNEVKITSNDILSGGGDKTIERILDISRIGIAADLYGTSVEAFERCIAYIKERKQFGVELATFQGLQHRAAIMYCELELCLSAVMNALNAIDNDKEDFALEASIAKAKMSKVAQLVTNEAIQFYGGIGMTDDEEIGFFLKRARVAMALLGDHNYHLDRFARLSGY